MCEILNSQLEYSNQACTVCNYVITIPSCVTACTCVKIYLALWMCTTVNTVTRHVLCATVCVNNSQLQNECVLSDYHTSYMKRWLQVQTADYKSKQTPADICKVVDKDGVEEAYSLFQDMLLSVFDWKLISMAKHIKTWWYNKKPEYNLCLEPLQPELATRVLGTA